MPVQGFWLQTPKFQHFQLVQDFVPGMSHLQRNAQYSPLNQLPPQSPPPPAEASLTFTTTLSSNIQSHIPTRTPAVAARSADAGQDWGCHQHWERDWPADAQSFMCDTIRLCIHSRPKGSLHTGIQLKH